MVVPTSRQMVFQFIAGPVWFAVIGPLIPGLIAAPSSFSFVTKDDIIEVIEVGILLYTLGGPVAAFCGLVFTLALWLLLRYRPRLRPLFSLKNRALRAAILTAVVITVISLGLLPIMLALEIANAWLLLFFAPTLVCGFTYTFWLLRDRNA